MMETMTKFITKTMEILLNRNVFHLLNCEVLSFLNNYNPEFMWSFFVFGIFSLKVLPKEAL